MREMSSWGEFHLLIRKNNGENPRRGIQVPYMLSMEQWTDMGRRYKVQNRTKKAMVESNAVNGCGCLLPGYCSLVFFGLQCQVSACADVRVRMTSGMPSVFVSEATGGAKGVAGGGEQW